MKSLLRELIFVNLWGNTKGDLEKIAFCYALLEVLRYLIINSLANRFAGWFQAPVMTT